jgi:hypothetical protein
VLGAVTIAVWARLRRPARPAAAADPERLRLRRRHRCLLTLLAWLVAETRDGAVLGLAERLTTSIQTSWPFIIAIALRRTRHPRPGPAAGGSGGAKHGPPRGPGPAAAGRTGDGSPEAPRAGVRPGTVTAPARRAGPACPRLPAAAELATTGAATPGMP